MTTTDTTTELWDDVQNALGDPNVHLIAWDGCHKIYIALDDDQALWFRENYEITVDGGAHSEGRYKTLITTLAEWWEESCGLRFINGVAGSEYNPQFTTLIAQFADQEDYEEDE